MKSHYNSIYETKENILELGNAFNSRQTINMSIGPKCSKEDD